MEWCPMCQVLKPFQVYNINNQWFKHCRDCNALMGMFTAEEANKINVERNFYKSKFYNEELKSCVKNQD
jgi:hypothetical protein